MPVIDIVLAVVAGLVFLAVLITLIGGVWGGYQRELQEEKQEPPPCVGYGARTVDPKLWR